MSKLFSAVLTGVFLVSAGTCGVANAQSVKSATVQMKDSVKNKVKAEQSEEKAEDQAERQYEAAKEKSEDLYDAAREQCEKLKARAESSCKKQARERYKAELARAKTERKKMSADAHAIGETGKSK